mmetsp:Transcript_32893/g.49640  ORF Transcript_32893/g.49640 Transcript_32893/m.49640 type:complete len:767 (+) Transcript_32893:231-2531(+)|eukprot:CAMPEP_0178909104 /NCGR_PEP_ID=MMETSP0786-20121207/8308_1 /TAXON_ID=186022 /ORGANISM="Thalassionema frauenfeldii, Strain CCMP 1798" /LENGTH=766 /DNA_ID=CAMNT_0020581111 /DNA_START=135 /DNA_END=2435 /DNA_ORIENTATION=-
MDYCGGHSYRPSEDKCSEEISKKRDIAPASARKHSFDCPPTPDTPASSASYVDDIHRLNHNGAITTPVLLNPLTEEDWSTRRRFASPLDNCFIDDITRKLEKGVSVVWKSQEEQTGERLSTKRCSVIMKFDSTKVSLIFIPKNGKNDENEANPRNCNSIAPLPLSSIDSVEEHGENFRLKIVPADSQSTHNYEFEIPYERGYIDRSFTEGLRKLLRHSKSSQTRNRNFNLPMRRDNITSLPSLSLDQTKDDYFADKTAQNAAREIHVFETHSNKDSKGVASYPPASPADQGMELALIGPRFSSSDAHRNLNVPILGENIESSSCNQLGSLTQTQSRDEDDADIDIREIPGDFMSERTLQTKPSVHETSVTGPWCEADLCTLTIQEISEAFSDIFGVKKMSPNQTSDVQDFMTCKDTNVSDYVEPGFMREACIGINHRRSFSASEHNFRNDNIRNRKNMNAKAKRRQQLLYKLTFAAVKDISAKKMFHVQTTKSSDEAETHQSNPTPLAKAKSLIHIFGTYMKSEQRIDDDEETENVLYYDSDLEDARERTFLRGPRQALAEKMNRSGESRFRAGSKLRIPRKILKSSSVTNAEIKTIVSMMKSFTFSLLWHPNPTNEDPLPTPLCVQAWIERGTYLMNQNYVQPKFMWKTAFEGELATKRKINLDIEKIGLLEIARIDGSPKDIDRTIFPFAHRPSCFVIKTKTNYFLFQTQSATEQAHMVFGLKLVVARLASLLIVRHMAAVEEFFEPNDSTVPGKVPGCISGKP